MRIINVIQCGHLGGMEQASLRLMRALRARGHELRLVSLNRIGGLNLLLEVAGIPSRSLDYAKNGAFGTALELHRALAAERADALIMTGHNVAAFLALGDVCRGRRVLAMHFHHQGVMPDWHWRLLYRLAKSRFDTITFPSDYVRREAETIAPFVKGMAVTVRNPLEIPPASSVEGRPRFRAQFGIDPQAPLIGNAGWLIARKRFDVFLEAAAEIAKLRPDSWFVIAGDGELRGALEQKAIALGLADRLVWTGWQRDLSGFYAAIDVLLFNSDWDAFPTTPIEAMSHGIPLVASLRHGGLGEVLDDSCGWFFEEHNIAKLARAAVESLSAMGAKKAAKARERIAQTSDPASIAADMEGYLMGQNLCKN